MPGPKAAKIELDEKTKSALEKLEKGHKTRQQIAKRAKIIRLVDEGKSDKEIAKEVSVSRLTVFNWRHRWQQLEPLPLSELTVEERLEDLPRSGKPPRITAEQRCQLEAIACQPPESFGRPISQWTSRELADEMVKQGKIEQLSRRHAARLLKRSLNSSPQEPLLAEYAQG